MRRLSGLTLLLAASCSKLAPIEARHERAPVAARTLVSEPTPMAGAGAGRSGHGAEERGRPAPPNDNRLAPLEGPQTETWQVDDVEMVVSIPVGAREKRPILVGVHGAQDRPDWSCAEWQATVVGWAFVVCPKGIPWRRRDNSWGAPSVLAERADRALAALRERYASYVADGPVVYAGWSQGGTLASKVVASRPGVYDTAILVEVGHTRLDARGAVAGLSKGRVSRVIVSCATTRCAGLAKRMEKASEGDFAFTMNDGGIGRGHFFDELMFRTLGRTIAQSTAGDPRWAGFASAVETRWRAEDARTAGAGGAAAPAPAP